MAPPAWRARSGTSLRVFRSQFTSFFSATTIRPVAISNATVTGGCDEASGRDFELRRLAIYEQDIARFHLPPQKIKPTDPRSAGFQRRYGKHAPTIELDALPVDELRARVRSAIQGLIDVDLWKRQLAIQEVEMSSIVQFAERARNLPT